MRQRARARTTDRIPVPYRAGRHRWHPDRSARSLMSWLWAFVPFVLPVGPAIPFAIAALIRRSKVYALAAGGYFAMIVAAGIAHGTTGDEALGNTLVSAAYIGAFLNAQVVRRRVFGLSRRDADELAAGQSDAIDAPDPNGLMARRPQFALAQALKGRELRQEARELLERDPGLAEELGIGRPELGRGFDDGGLIDVNHAPASVILSRLPGLTAEQAAQIVAVRGQLGGFESLADLEVHTDIPAGLLDRLSERMVYVRDV